MEEKEIIVIPASENISSSCAKKTKKLKVAAYARVSTSSDEQINSIEMQKLYYENYIKEHKGWEFVGIYADEGISGTSMKNRGEFKRLIADATAGKIDLILTKSISRFARNTVDTLQYTRLLKEHGVAIYFEKEKINSAESTGEFLLTLLSSLAQEESRSMSENVKWGKRKAFAEGRYGMGYSTFLGYDKGSDGKLVINPEQAEIVRLIYLRFVTGTPVNWIIRELNESNMPSPGRKQWWTSTILSILRNEKYKVMRYYKKLISKIF